jgi:peptidoglycan pentaglycine glycine transferase (the first glycine)
MYEQHNISAPPTFTTTTTIDNATWFDFVQGANGNFLQSPAWGEAKAKWGWIPRRVGVESKGTLIAGAQVLFRTLPLGFSIAYIPRAPITLNDHPTVLDALWHATHSLCRRHRAVLLTVEPDWQLPTNKTALLRVANFRPAPATIQPSATIMLDLRPSEEEVLGQMHQKWRYNIRSAGRKEIVVRRGTAADIPTFHALTLTTGERDDFAVRPADYYADVFRAFGDQAKLYLAEFEGKVLGAIMVVRAGDTAVYLYGASSNEERQRMPNHALQWRAMQEAKAEGATWYDFWGIPPEVPESGEVETLGEGGLWGVFRFKQGFGGKVVKYPGAFDYVYNLPGYWLYAYLRKRRGGDH